MLLDITTEGLRLQIVDQTKRPMFDPGSADLKYYSEDILWELAPVLATLEHRLSITGHTDSSKAAGVRVEDDINWSLSSMRADSARRALMEAGVPKSQIAQVIGMGDTAPLKADDPGNSVNRRISITMLNQQSDNNIRGRAGATDNPDIEFINDGEDETTNNDDRKPVINKAGSLLDELRQQRESKENTYDNPPNREEIFW